MRAYLPFLIIGLTTGAIYAMASTGLVLTYVTSGVFNFAHGAVGMFATYLFFELRDQVGVPTPLALGLAVLVVAPALGVVIDRAFIRRLEGAPAAAYVVASVGLLVLLQSLAIVIYGGNTRRVETFLPTGTFRLLTVNVGADQLIIVALALLTAGGLIAFFRTTRLGLETRAVVNDRDLTGLVGTNAAAVTTFSWMLGSAFATLSGILIAPSIGLDPILLTLLVVEAFGAAVVGRLRSFPRTLLAAFGIGVVQSLAVKFVSGLGVRSLAGLPSAVPFLTLFAVLLFSPRGSFIEATIVRARTTPRRRRGTGAKFPWRSFVAAAVVAVVLPPFLNGSQVFTLTSTCAFVLLFSSLSLLIGLSRQVSLAHATFVALGATSCAHLVSAGVPLPLAIILGALILVPVGAVLAVPAIRLSGLFLALATFGFGILVQNLLFATGLTFGAAGTVQIPRPTALAGDVTFHYFILAMVLLGVLVVETVRITRLGRVLRALADAPNAVSAVGISPLVSRVITFCLSAFLAGLSGGLLGALYGSVTPSSFGTLHSLLWVAVLVFAGARTLGGAILGAVLLITVPAVFNSPTVAEWQPVVFGAAAMLLARSDNGLVGLARLPEFGPLLERDAWRLGSRRWLERYAARLAPATRPETPIAAMAADR